MARRQITSHSLHLYKCPMQSLVNQQLSKPHTAAAVAYTHALVHTVCMRVQSGTPTYCTFGDDGTATYTNEYLCKHYTCSTYFERYTQKEYYAERHLQLGFSTLISKCNANNTKCRIKQCKTLQVLHCLTKSPVLPPTEKHIVN